MNQFFWLANLDQDLCNFTGIQEPEFDTLAALGTIDKHSQEPGLRSLHLAIWLVILSQTFRRA